MPQLVFILRMTFNYIGASVMRSVNDEHDASFLSENMHWYQKDSPITTAHFYQIWLIL